MIKGKSEGLRRLLRRHVPMLGLKTRAGIGYQPGAEHSVYQTLNRAVMAGRIGFRDTIDAVTKRTRTFELHRPRIRSLERFDS